MREVSSTWFGLTIAYLLPGVAGLFSATFWFDGARNIFRTFLTTQANVGLFLLVLSAALAVGLLVNGIRWAMFEGWRRKAYLLDPLQFARLSSEEKLLAFRWIVEEHYRYYQFFGNVALSLLPLFGGWLKNSWSGMPLWINILLVTGFVLLETVNIWAAIRAYRTSVDRARAILEGDENA